MSPRTKQQNSQIKDERSEQLLLAALKIFARRGLAATKISDIAQAANLSYGLVYHYFESKEHVFVELVSRALEQSTKTLQQIDLMPLEPVEKIRTIADCIVKSIYETEESAYYFLLMLQAMVSDANPQAVKEMIGQGNAYREIMVKIIETGQKKGCIPEGSSQDYVTLYWAAIQGLALQKIALGEGDAMPDLTLLMRMFEK